MNRPKFGEVLSKFVELSPHDVSEILEDQSSSRRRFGEIALAFGLCKPHHVWKAWWAQLSGAPERVDLEVIGIDAQCLAYIPRSLALEFSAIPIRASGSQIVVAAAEGALMRAMEELPRRLKIQMKFVTASAGQIRHAIDSYYGWQSPEHKRELETAAVA